MIKMLCRVGCAKGAEGGCYCSGAPQYSSSYLQGTLIPVQWTRGTTTKKEGQSKVDPFSLKTTIIG